MIFYFWLFFRIKFGFICRFQCSFVLPINIFSSLWELNLFVKFVATEERMIVCGLGVLDGPTSLQLKVIPFDVLISIPGIHYNIRINS